MIAGPDHRFGCGGAREAPAQTSRTAFGRSRAAISLFSVDAGDDHVEHEQDDGDERGHRIGPRRTSA
jgi:hypothetical protein